MKTVDVDNLRDAVNKTISFENANGKKYQHDEKTAVLMVRPRGWHLEEKHVLLDGNPISGSLFDFAFSIMRKSWCSRHRPILLPS
jgi:malate synthase